MSTINPDALDVTKPEEGEATTASVRANEAATKAQLAAAKADIEALEGASEANDLTAAVTWANVPDANITQSSVTQHEAALTITESQVSDLGTYATAATTLTAGAGLTGGGDLSVGRTFDVGAGAGIAVAADAVAVDINGLTPDGTPDGAADYVATYDASAGGLKKVLLDNLPGGGGGASQLSDLSDVNTSTPTNRNALLADGVDWESRAIVEADISDLGTYAVSGGAFHDGFSDYVAAEHVSHASVSITAGAGLTGGGTLEATRDLAVGAGEGISVAADAVAVDIAGLTAQATPAFAVDYVAIYDDAAGALRKVLLEDLPGGGGAGINNVVEDLTPQLGGALDVNGQGIVSVSAGNITITPDTTGSIVLDGLSWPQADGTDGQVLTTDGAGNLAFEAAAGGGGDVSKVGTPADNQVGVWTGDGTIEGTAGLTYTGSALGITGDVTVSGTVDGRDVATDGTKLDGIEAAADVTDATNVAAAGALMSGSTTFSTSHTWAIQGAISNGTPPGMFAFVGAGETAAATRLKAVLGAGTCTIQLQLNGSDIVGATKSVSTTAGTPIDFSDDAVADGDLVTCVITSATGASNLSVTLEIERTL